MPDKPMSLKRDWLQTTFSNMRRMTPSSKRRPIHFLHIGKTAGTHLKSMLERINEAQQELEFIGHRHKVRLADLPAGEDYFFSIRDPIARFVSGFYSRKREGRPRYDMPWTDHERQAFTDFDHANDLAEALFQPGLAGMRAVGAIKAISHTARNQVDWFSLRGEVFSVREPVWIVRQEQFESDLAMLLERCGLESTPAVSHREGKSHVTDYSEIPPISPE